MSEASALDIATLVIAIIGALTGVVAIAWNVIEFALAGPRIAVEVAEGRTNGIYQITGPGLWRDDPAYAGPEMPHRVVVISVTNKGRSPVTVAKTGLRYSNGVELGTTDDFNHRIEAYENHTWRIPFLDASAVVITSRHMGEPTTSARAFADLATGKKVLSKRALMIP